MRFFYQRNLIVKRHYPSTPSAAVAWGHLSEREVNFRVQVIKRLLQNEKESKRKIFQIRKDSALEFLDYRNDESGQVRTHFSYLMRVFLHPAYSYTITGEAVGLLQTVEMKFVTKRTHRGRNAIDCYCQACDLHY